VTNKNVSLVKIMDQCPADIIRNWLTNLLSLQNSAGFDTCLVDIECNRELSDEINNDCGKVVNVITGSLDGDGGFTFDNGDYFEGEFHGCLENRCDLNCRLE
jgi:hypothetical protein